VKVTLTIGGSRGRAREVVIDRPQGLIIGRARDADVRIATDDPYGARRHVYLEVCPPSCRLQDLGSRNPPHVNGRPVTDCLLRDGDVVQLGYTRLRVSISLDASIRIWTCEGCGRRAELVSDERRPGLCDDCEGRGRRRGRVRQVHCAGCGRSLTAQANSDGRAAEVAGLVTYVCQNCLPPGDDSAGRRVGAYEIRRRLGAGGMGIVHLAYHPSTARLVAVKEVQDLTNQLLIKRFQREVRILAGLSHPNIVHYLCLR
jgi:hypothetical protein